MPANAIIKIIATALAAAVHGSRGAAAASRWAAARRKDGTGERVAARQRPNEPLHHYQSAVVRRTLLFDGLGALRGVLI